MKITSEMLKQAKACEEQVSVFEKEWPKGIRVSKKAVLRALELRLDLYWAAQHLLPPAAFDVYDIAEADAAEVRRAKIDAASKTYDDKKAGAWNVYRDAVKNANEFYDAATIAAFLKAVKVSEKT
jgi:hypothetical protein